MNSHINALYVVIEDNEVLYADTNLSGFHKKVSKLEPRSPSYITLYRAFKKDYKFTKTISGKEYHFQKVL